MNNNIEASKPIAINQEQIKVIVGSLRKYAVDLEKVKSRADEIWEKCETYLDDNIINSIDTVKDINRKRYNSALEELNNYINKLETVANIWQDTEEQIKSSSIELENIFSEIGKTLSGLVNNKNN